MVLVSYLLLLGLLSLNPWFRPASNDDLLSPNKVDHALAYGGLAILVFLCINRPRIEYKRAASGEWLAAILIAVTVGILLEATQSLFTDYRNGCVADALVNAIGAILGYVAYNSARHIRLKLQ
jgi:VanZ family protein